MTDTAWSHLSTAQHIDWVIQSAKTDPAIWDDAWKQARGVAWQAALEASLEAAWESVIKAVKDGDLDDDTEEAVRDDVWYATTLAAKDDAWQDACNSALDVVRGGGVWGPACLAARDTDCDTAMYAAWDAILALIAWGSAGNLLGCQPAHVELLAQLGDPKAVLLLPAVIAWTNQYATDKTQTA